MTWSDSARSIPPADKRLLDVALHDKPEAFKRRVWEIVAASGIDADDPTFLMLVSLGRMEAYLDEVPEELERQIEQLRHLTSKVMAAARTLEERGVTLSRTGTFGAPSSSQRDRTQRDRRASGDFSLVWVAVGASIILSLLALFIPLVLLFQRGACPVPPSAFGQGAALDAPLIFSKHLGQ